MVALPANNPLPRSIHRCGRPVSWTLLVLGFVVSGATGLIAQNPESANYSSEISSSWETDSEWLHAGDIDLYNATLKHLREQNQNDWSITLLQSFLDIDYEPFAVADIIGTAQNLTELNVGLQYALTRSPSTFVSYQVSAGGYNGFSDHGSRWLDEYYHQQFSAFEGYREASPWGYNLGASVQWESPTLFGVVGAATTFQQDDVAPGYDRPLFQPLERGRERLYSGSLSLFSEQIITPRTRIRHEVQLTSTTDRELRVSYRGNLNLALGEYWVARAEAAITHENNTISTESDFRAHSIALNIERDWDERWFLGFHARSYEDNGQIETSILVSSGPPPLSTEQFGISLRWQHERWSSKLSASSYRTRYDDVASLIRPFGNLYRDRNWTLIESTLRFQY